MSGRQNDFVERVNRFTIRRRNVERHAAPGRDNIDDLMGGQHTDVVAGMPTRITQIAEFGCQIVAQQHPGIEIACINVYAVKVPACQKCVILIVQPRHKRTGDRRNFPAERVAVHVVSVHSRTVRHAATDLIGGVKNGDIKPRLTVQKAFDRIKGHRARADNRDFLGGIHDGLVQITRPHVSAVVPTRARHLA